MPHARHENPPSSIAPWGFLRQVFRALSVRQLLLILLFVLLVAGSVGLLGFRFQLTGSAPRGIYRFVDSVAVGTALRLAGSGRPPHRSQRAGLPHWAPTSGFGVKTLLRPGMQHARVRNPPFRQGLHSVPIHPRALTAAPKRLSPQAGYLSPKGLQPTDVSRYGVVAKIALEDSAEPDALIGKR